MAIYKRKKDRWFREEVDRMQYFYLGVAIEIEVKEVIKHFRSAFQEVWILDTVHYGKVLVQDGIFQTSEVDEYCYHVPMVGFSAAIHPKPERILIIGGGDMGVASKLSRFPDKLIKKIDVVEIDKETVEACREPFQEVFGHVWFDPRVNIYYEDGLEFVKKTKKRYDVIIVDCSEEIGPNKTLFGGEFYNNIEKCLRWGGIAIFQAGSMFYNQDQICEMYDLLKSKFDYLRVHRISVPLYMGDFALVAVMRDCAFPSRGKLARMYSLDSQRVNRWVNIQRYGASLVLPVDVEMELEKFGFSASQGY